jgi:signal transduction histidine kinase
MPVDRLTAAKRGAAWRIAAVAVAAALLATLVGLRLAASIARPVRDLADRMDRLTAEATTAADTGPSAGRPPAELVRLDASFQHLLARLDAARNQLARSARLAALGQISASVVHELRNPLSGIKMNARVLRDELAAIGRGDESLDVIIHEIDRMDLYLTELLSLRPGPDAADPTPAAPPVRVPTPLAPVVESVVGLLAHRCRHARVEVARRVPSDLPPVLGDADRIRQVVLNLMLNALDAMPAGGTITLELAARGHGRVRCTVRDTGPGVCLPAGQDAFAPFVTTKPNGVGLGLFVCRHLVTELGGTIGYDTGSAGSAFWFDLEVPADGNGVA